MQPALVEPGQMVAAQQQIGHRAKGHKGQHNDDPSDLIAGVAPVTDDPQHYGHTQHRHHDIKDVVIPAAQQGQQRPIGGGLQGNQHQHDSHAVKQDLSDFPQ